MSSVNSMTSSHKKFSHTADSMTLHDLAKGWKAAILRANDPASTHECRLKNDRGNLPLHTSASHRAPIDVTEALLESYPEAASVPNHYGNLALHFTAWKKGPPDVERLLLDVYPQGASCKNNHGNLPLHYAAHYHAPLEVVEALYKAYPEAAHQKNNDSNTPLDLAIADGASPKVVALLQGEDVPPTDEELYESSRSRVERAEKEIQNIMEGHDGVKEDLEDVLSLLMEIRNNHPHSLFCTGINIDNVEDGNIDSLLREVRKASQEESDGSRRDDDHTDEGSLGRKSVDSKAITREKDMADELRIIEEALVPRDDIIEIMLAKIVGLSCVKNQIRGMRRTIELEQNNDIMNKNIIPFPRHVAIVGNPGVGKTFVARLWMNMMYKIGAVTSTKTMEVGRNDLVDCKSEIRTISKTRSVLQNVAGGVLFVDEAYTLLPSSARFRERDHGIAALKELARTMNNENGYKTLVILTGYSIDLQLLFASDIGFTGKLILRIEFPEPTTTEVVIMFFSKMLSKGLVPADTLNINQVVQVIEAHTDADWRKERNGYIADLLLQAVRRELKKKQIAGGFGSVNNSTIHNPKEYLMILSPVRQKKPMQEVEEVLVTFEDVQNAVMAGL